MSGPDTTHEPRKLGLITGMSTLMKRPLVVLSLMLLPCCGGVDAFDDQHRSRDWLDRERLADVSALSTQDRVVACLKFEVEVGRHEFLSRTEARYSELRRQLDEAHHALVEVAETDPACLVPYLFDERVVSAGFPIDYPAMTSIQPMPVKIMVARYLLWQYGSNDLDVFDLVAVAARTRGFANEGDLQRLARWTEFVCSWTRYASQGEALPFRDRAVQPGQGWVPSSWTFMAPEWWPEEGSRCWPKRSRRSDPTDASLRR